jgi:hypothetical protein
MKRDKGNRRIYWIEWASCTDFIAAAVRAEAIGDIMSRFATIGDAGCHGWLVQPCRAEPAEL